MPNSTQTIDWPGIRAAAIAIGIRPAARQAGQNLPPIEQNRFVKRVLKRAEREKWLASRPIALAPAQAKPMSSHVVTGAQAVQTSIADTGREIRSHIARVALASVKRSKHLPLRTMKDLRDAASATQIVDPQGEERSAITLNVLNVNGDMHTGG